MSDYWSKKLRTPTAPPATVDVATEVPAQTVRASATDNNPTALPTIYVSQDRATGAGYLTLICLLLFVAALDNRHGSRLPFLLSALAVLVGGTVLLWRADLDALRRIELEGDDGLVLIGKQRRCRIALADLVRLDTASSKVSQLLGWHEMSFHSSTGVERVRRVDDPGDLVWQLRQSRPSLNVDIRSDERPWVVNIAVLTVCLNAALGAVAFLLAARSDAVSTNQLVFGIGINCVALVCGLCLLSSSYLAWVVFVVLSLLVFGLVLINEHWSALTLANAVVWLAVLFSPGVRRWAPAAESALR